MQNRKVEIQAHLLRNAQLCEQTTIDCSDSILGVADLIADTFRAGGKLLLCGNGGSAADSQHMAAEFVSLLTQDFQRPGLPAIALTTDTSFLTAYANDFGFDGVFERQVRTLGRAGDLLIGISTSGNSANVLRAIQAAREMGMMTVGLSGLGGEMSKHVDRAVVVPSQSTQHIQEVLLSIEHIICFLVERQIFSE